MEFNIQDYLMHLSYTKGRCFLSFVFCNSITGIAAGSRHAAERQIQFREECSAAQRRFGIVQRAKRLTGRVDYGKGMVLQAPSYLRFRNRIRCRKVVPCGSIPREGADPVLGSSFRYPFKYPPLLISVLGAIRCSPPKQEREGWRPGQPSSDSICRRLAKGQRKGSPPRLL